jgi:DNA-binding transcriptional regulator YiaG
MRYDEQCQLSPNELKEFMQKFGFTVRSLSDLLGVSTTCVIYWCAGKRKVPETTARLLRYFERYPNAILDF